MQIITNIGEAVLEIGKCGYDIYQMNKSYEAGEMTEKDFKKKNTTRVCQAATGTVSAIVGFTLGMFVGGLIGGIIPGVGNVIGAAKGAALGCAIGGYVGKLLGSKFGRWLGNKLW